MSNDSIKASSELEGLFVDNNEQAVDATLRSVLEPYGGLTRDGKIVTKPLFLELSVSSRIISVLLLRQAAVRLGVHGALAEASAEDLASDCMAPLKTCRELLSRLKKKRLLSKGEIGYSVPNWALLQAAREIGGKGK